jgi:uncharacterized membrane protein YhaH (DUF805 family)
MNDLTSLSTTDGRITRRQYAALLGICLGMSVMAVLIAKVLAFFGGIIGLAALGVMFMGAVRRAHDCGRSGWFLLIPFYNVWLFFESGEQGANRFGDDHRVPPVGN